MPSVTPFLWFDTDLAEPIAYYTSIFPDATPVTGRCTPPPSSCAASG